MWLGRILELRLQWALKDAAKPQRGREGEGSSKPSRIIHTPAAFHWQKMESQETLGCSTWFLV